jgi:hypothetical protein
MDVEGIDNEKRLVKMDQTMDWRGKIVMAIC